MANKNLQIVIPLAGGNQFFDGPAFVYPKPLVEIDGKPMIEWVIRNCKSLQDNGSKIVFIAKEPECSKFNLDYTLKMLAPNCKVVKLIKETKGAVCSVLMTLDELNLNDPVLILNGDQLLDITFTDVIDWLEENQADAGVVCFPSVHPKWSYVKPGQNNMVLETAEKKPISNKAIAGFYYFKQTSDFIEAATKAIINDRSLDDIFYISFLMNEMILLNKKVMFKEIASDEYHSFYSPAKIEEFEKKYLNTKKFVE
jgi:NDP-sugar pyrophosphorylase family protein